jgi:Sulfotransferase domain
VRVIGSGFGRTGTASLKAALETLGSGPCYHMIEVFRHPEHAAPQLRRMIVVVRVLSVPAALALLAKRAIL